MWLVASSCSRLSATCRPARYVNACLGKYCARFRNCCQIGREISSSLISSDNCLTVYSRFAMRYNRKTRKAVISSFFSRRVSWLLLLRNIKRSIANWKRLSGALMGSEESWATTRAYAIRRCEREKQERISYFREAGIPHGESRSAGPGHLWNPRLCHDTRRAIWKDR
jgi:hypothetical protein